MELPFSGTAALVIGSIFFLVMAIVAYFVFRILRKSVKMAFRLALVAGFLIIASVGSFSLWWFATTDSPKPKANPVRTR